MQVKLFELRDRATMIQIFAFRCRATADAPSEAAHLAQDALLRSAGYGDQADGLVMVGPLRGGACHYDEYAFGGARTYPIAVRYIRENWDKLNDGDVICVEHISGERDTPKESEVQGRY